jgi:hypothetical protein
VKPQTKTLIFAEKEAALNSLKRVATAFGKNFVDSRNVAMCHTNLEKITTTTDTTDLAARGQFME